MTKGFCLSFSPVSSLTPYLLTGEISAKTLAALPSADLGELFTQACFATAVAPVLVEHEWLISRGSGSAPSLEEFLALALTRELAPLAACAEWLLKAKRKDLRKWATTSQNLTRETTLSARASADPKRFHEFCHFALARMDELVRYERALPENFLLNALDRAFEEMDQVFGIHFDHEAREASRSETVERVFAGSGIGVQSSYTSLLLSLAQLSPGPGAHFIDLGSGYGRAGLTLGILRPDMKCTGYEYVAHRVDMANDCAHKAGVGGAVSFFTQDLSDPSFQIPRADIYYLYDPFSEETYRFVLEQLRQLGRKHAVVVATRGHASAWVAAALNEENWSAQHGPDQGHLSLFRSRPVAC